MSPAKKTVKKKTKKVHQSKTHKKNASKKNAVSPVFSSHFQKTPRYQSGITLIKVIGVGGGGGNAVSRMMEGEKLKGVEFIAANTDSQDLNYALAHKKIYLGKALTRGLGAGMNPDIGKQAAEENRSEIGESMEGADVVFITAGMGGGTGTGASPIIAEIARERGILTVAIVTKPFSFEGTQRMNIAQEGLMRLKDKVDALIIVPNDRIFAVTDKDTSITKAFSYVDEILKNAVQGLAELINNPGIINVDFADIKSIMKDAGTTLIGIGIASGADRGSKAVQTAVNSPLLESSIEGARGVLFSIAGGKDMKMSEINEIARTISSSVDQSARIIFGAYHDRKLKDKSIKVTVIGTGFNGSFTGGARYEIPSLFGKKSEKDDLLSELYKDRDSLSEDEAEPVKEKSEKTRKVSVQKEDEEEWDIPAFLRKGKKDKDKK